MKQSIDTLNKIGKSYGVIINRAGLGNTDVYDWLKENNIRLLMEIPFDEEIARIYSEGRILAEDNINYRTQFWDLFERINHITRN